MDINRIENSTLAKLTAKEIGALGLCNYGVGLYKGELKSRRNGLKTIKVSEKEIHFEGTVSRIEFVQIVSDGSEKHWAARIFRKPSYPNEIGKYDTYPMGIFGCDFIK